MPAPIDLTGRRFGCLLVLRREGYAQWGRRVSTWRIRCDCGREEVYPLPRLPYADYLPPSHLVTACSVCRLTRACVECGSPFVPSGGGGSQRVTCSDPCAEEHRKRKQRRSWHRRVQADPDLPRRMNEARRARALLDRDYAALLRDWETQREARRSERLRTEPAYAEAERARGRDFYARHAARIQVKRRERLDAMTAAERLDWLERTREYSRVWREKWRADLVKDPARHQEYIDLQREYRRQRELAKLQATGDELLRRLHG